MHFKNPILVMELKLKMKNISIPVIIVLYNVFFALISIVSLINFSDLSAAAWDSSTMDLISIFFFCGMLQSIFVFFLAPLCTANTISGERERGTLDLLLSSPVRPIQIILEKLVANILIVLLFSMSSMPILSIEFIFGGVGLRQYLFFFFILLLISFFCISIGIYCSCAANKSVGAFLLTIFIEIFFTLGNIYLILFLGNIDVFQQVAGCLLLINPLVLIVWLYDEMTGESLMLYLARQFFGGEQEIVLTFLKAFPFLCIFVQILVGILFIYFSVCCIERKRES